MATTVCDVPCSYYKFGILGRKWVKCELTLNSDLSMVLKSPEVSKKTKKLVENIYGRYTVGLQKVYFRYTVGTVPRRVKSHSTEKKLVKLFEKIFCYGFLLSNSQKIAFFLFSEKIFVINGKV